MMNMTGCLGITLLQTNISNPKALLKMIFPFPWWDILVPWRVDGLAYLMTLPKRKFFAISGDDLAEPKWLTVEEVRFADFHRWASIEWKGKS